MSLSIVIAPLAEVLQLDDEESIEYQRENLQRINTLLTAQGLPAHDEPEQAPPMLSRCGTDGFPYSWIHHLRRASAYRTLYPTWNATPLTEDQKPTSDPILTDADPDWLNHLISHSDAEGYYIPVDFKTVIFDDDLPGKALGSSQRLLHDLILVAPAIGIDLRNGILSDEHAQAIDNDIGSGIDTGLYRERGIWLGLYEAARISIAHKCAIAFA
jgi:hypothetical protein